MNLKEELKQLPLGARDLRRFGLLVGGVFALLTLWFWFRGRDFWWWCLIPAVPLLLLGAVYPRSLRLVYLGWMSLALILGLVVSTILLTIFFYLVITPMGLVARLVGKDFLSLKLNPAESSYWIRREQKAERNPSEYERQY
jgi:hypothetical protein